MRSRGIDAKPHRPGTGDFPLRRINGARDGAAIRTRDLIDRAVELVELRQYEELAALIRQIDPIDQESDSEIRSHLELARSLCCACSDDKADATWHEEAITRIANREDELKRGLMTVLHVLDGAAKTPEDREAPISVSTCASSTHRGHLLPAIERLIPRQRIHIGRMRKSASGRRESDRRRTTARAAPRTPREVEREIPSSPLMAVYCLGPFQVYLDDRCVEDWPNGKGKAIFKFLVMHRDRPVGKEILMDLFWANFDPRAARNNLNVAISTLRRAIARVNRSCSVVLFRNDCYFLNPDVDTWVDYEEFADHLVAAHNLEGRGELTRAMDKLRSAEALYRGELLEEDRYEDWPDPLRRSLQDDYLALLDRLSEYSLEREEYGDCVALCTKILSIDPCYEDSHRRLMRCWSRQDQHHLAVRQYHICRDSLLRQLELPPGRTTTQLFEQIRQGEAV
jgi:DNA-binding SARP family transcriptional activator